MPTELNRLISELPDAGIARAGRLGLELAPQLDPEAWRHLVTNLARLARTTTGARQTLTAWLGDALAYGELRYRGRIATCANEAGLEPGTLRNAKMVCSRIPVSCRHDVLSWTHHCEVGLAFADLAEIERWLTIAQTEKLSTAALRKRIRAHQADRRRGQVATTHPTSTEAFQFFRELRAACRTLEKRRGLWQKWLSGTARTALEEIKPMADFIDGLRARALGPDPSRPPDITLN